MPINFDSNSFGDIDTKQYFEEKKLSTQVDTEEILNKGIELYNQKNYSAAFSLFEKAAEAGNSNAQQWYGWCLEHGQGTAMNPPLAFTWYNRSAEDGNIYAQFNVGECYAKGIGINQSWGNCAIWMTKAANNGNVDAQNYLGWLYDNGNGVTKDFKRAFEWFKTAADHNHSTALRNVGLYYENGTYVPKDINKALDFYNRAVSAGNDSAKEDIQRLTSGSTVPSYDNLMLENTSSILRIYGSDETPNVLFTRSSKCFIVQGRSLPVDATLFYQPILNWLNKYAKNPLPQTVFEFKFEYFNTASSKLILDIMLILEDISNSGNDVLIKWYYPDDDRDMEEAGNEYSDIVDVPFEMVPYNIEID